MGSEIKTVSICPQLLPKPSLGLLGAGGILKRNKMAGLLTYGLALEKKLEEHRERLNKLNSHSPSTLKVRAWFEQSTKCKRVGTGEFEEVMEVVCEE